MDIVGGGESLPLTARANLYILTLVDCLTRYAIAIPVSDQSSEAVNNAVIGNYITVYGTPRRILTDHGKCFESALFQSFCNIFRIYKVRTSGYRPQSKTICKRFNQTLKYALRKLLHKSQHANWDLYLYFVVISYNTSIHSSTGFTPKFLTFGAEARLPADLVFGASDPDALESLSNNQDGHGRSAGLQLLFKSFSNLHTVFASVRLNLEFVHSRDKDRYDLGTVERVFHPGDTVKIRLQSRHPRLSKFKSELSGPHEVVRVRGVVVTVREASQDVSTIPTTTVYLIRFFLENLLPGIPPKR